ncbi:MAG: RNA-binding S4 domain-containing protein [Candidatus Faecivivens sp.]|nr:RNA-binding S4 domain-containing protein [Oscillospiraceae bacterium]MDY2711798.1 RNA-binding S4 domain-containing protein [Candidatus Faecivivens sp.]
MTIKYVKLKTLWIRLDQLLKFAGVAESGGQAKEMILGEEVQLNGELCLARGKKIFPGDVITLDGVEIIVKN